MELDQAFGPLAVGCAGAPGAEAPGLAGSVTRLRDTRIEKFDTRRWSRGVKAMLDAVISPNSGRESHGLLLAKLRRSSETRSFDWATPVMDTNWLSCFMLVM